MRSTPSVEERQALGDMGCPWCDAALPIAPTGTDCQTCPDCLTTWRYEDETTELALAA